MNFKTAAQELCINRTDVRELARKHQLNMEQISALSAMSQKLAATSNLNSSSLTGMMIM